MIGALSCCGAVIGAAVTIHCRHYHQRHHHSQHESDVAIVAVGSSMGDDVVAVAAVDGVVGRRGVVGAGVGDIEAGAAAVADDMCDVDYDGNCYVSVAVGCDCCFSRKKRR